jgi:hypothetical protein
VSSGHWLQPHDLAELRQKDLGVTVRRQSHHLSLVAGETEAQVLSHRAIQHAQRVGEANLVQLAQRGAFAHTQPGGRPLADGIRREDRRLLERRQEEPAGRVRYVMLHVVNPTRLALLTQPQVAAQRALEVQHRQEVLHQATAHQPERTGQIAHDVSELIGYVEPRVPVVRDVVYIVYADPGLLQAVADGVDGEIHRVLLADEALFFRHGDHLAVPQQCSGGIVPVTVETQDIHLPTTSSLQ